MLKKLRRNPNSRHGTQHPHHADHKGQQSEQGANRPAEIRPHEEKDDHDPDNRSEIASSQTMARSSAEITFGPARTAPGYREITSANAGETPRRHLAGGRVQVDGRRHLRPCRDHITLDDPGQRRALEIGQSEWLAAIEGRHQMVDSLVKCFWVEAVVAQRRFETFPKALQRRCRFFKPGYHGLLDLERWDHAGDGIDADQVLAIDQGLDLRQNGAAFGQRFGLVVTVESQNHRCEAKIEGVGDLLPKLDRPVVARAHVAKIVIPAGAKRSPMPSATVTSRATTSVTPGRRMLRRKR